MTDKERIEQLEQENAELRKTLKQLLKNSLTGYDGNYKKAAARCREHAQRMLEEAENYDELVALLKEKP